VIRSCSRIFKELFYTLFQVILFSISDYDDYFRLFYFLFQAMMTLFQVDFLGFFYFGLVITIFQVFHLLFQAGDDEPVDHPSDLKDIVMFSFKKNSLFSKKKVTFVYTNFSVEHELFINRWKWYIWDYYCISDWLMKVDIIKQGRL
jgi:hypothetical protein